MGFTKHVFSLGLLNALAPFPFVSAAFVALDSVCEQLAIVLPGVHCWLCASSATPLSYTSYTVTCGTMLSCSHVQAQVSQQIANLAAGCCNGGGAGTPSPPRRPGVR
jgi:hypothetical protein